MIIYRVLNKVNGKCYIGQTKMPLCERIKAHINKQTRIGSVIKESKREDIEIRIIDITETKEEADKAERYWIRYYNSINNGYNILQGGTPTKEEMKIISGIKRKKKENKKRKKEKTSKKIKRFDKMSAVEWRNKTISSSKKNDYVKREKEKKKENALKPSMEEMTMNLILMQSKLLA